MAPEKDAVRRGYVRFVPTEQIIREYDWHAWLKSHQGRLGKGGRIPDKAKADGWIDGIRCVSHEDKKPSGSFNVKEGKFQCHANCGSVRVLDYMARVEGLPDWKAAGNKIRADLGYDYTDAGGRLVRGDRSGGERNPPAPEIRTAEERRSGLTKPELAPIPERYLPPVMPVHAPAVVAQAERKLAENLVVMGALQDRYGWTDEQIRAAHIGLYGRKVGIPVNLGGSPDGKPGASDIIVWDVMAQLDLDKGRRAATLTTEEETRLQGRATKIHHKIDYRDPQEHHPAQLWAVNGDGHRGTETQPKGTAILVEGVTDGVSIGLHPVLRDRYDIYTGTGGAQKFDPAYGAAFRGYEKVIVLYDNDPAGALGSAKAAEVIERAGVPDVRGANWSAIEGAGHKFDLTDLVKRDGVTGIDRMIEHSLPADLVKEQAAFIKARQEAEREATQSARLHHPPTPLPISMPTAPVALPPPDQARQTHQPEAINLVKSVGPPAPVVAEAERMQHWLDRFHAGVRQVYESGMTPDGTDRRDQALRRLLERVPEGKGFAAAVDAYVRRPEAAGALLPDPTDRIGLTAQSRQAAETLGRLLESIREEGRLGSLRVEVLGRDRATAPGESNTGAVDPDTRFREWAKAERGAEHALDEGFTAAFGSGAGAQQASEAFRQMIDDKGPLAAKAVLERSPERFGPIIAGEGDRVRAVAYANRVADSYLVVRAGGAEWIADPALLPASQGNRMQVLERELAAAEATVRVRIDGYEASKVRAAHDTVKAEQAADPPAPGVVSGFPKGSPEREVVDLARMTDFLEQKVRQRDEAIAVGRPGEAEKLNTELARYERTPEQMREQLRAAVERLSTDGRQHVATEVANRVEQNREGTVATGRDSRAEGSAEQLRRVGLEVSGQGKSALMDQAQESLGLKVHQGNLLDEAMEQRYQAALRVEAKGYSLAPDATPYRGAIQLTDDGSPAMRPTVGPTVGPMIVPGGNRATTFDPGEHQPDPKAHRPEPIERESVAPAGGVTERLAAAVTSKAVDPAEPAVVNHHRADRFEKPRVRELVEIVQDASFRLGLEARKAALTHDLSLTTRPKERERLEAEIRGLDGRMGEVADGRSGDLLQREVARQVLELTPREIEMVRHRLEESVERGSDHHRGEGALEVLRKAEGELAPEMQRASMRFDAGQEQTIQQTVQLAELIAQGQDKGWTPDRIERLEGRLTDRLRAGDADMLAETARRVIDRGSEAIRHAFEAAYDRLHTPSEPDRAAALVHATAGAVSQERLIGTEQLIDPEPLHQRVARTDLERREAIQRSLFDAVESQPASTLPAAQRIGMETQPTSPPTATTSAGPMTEARPVLQALQSVEDVEALHTEVIATSRGPGQALKAEIDRPMGLAGTDGATGRAYSPEERLATLRGQAGDLGARMSAVERELLRDDEGYDQIRAYRDRLEYLSDRVYGEHSEQVLARLDRELPAPPGRYSPEEPMRDLTRDELLTQQRLYDRIADQIASRPEHYAEPSGRDGAGGAAALGEEIGLYGSAELSRLRPQEVAAYEALMRAGASRMAQLRSEIRDIEGQLPTARRASGGVTEVGVAPSDPPTVMPPSALADIAARLAERTAAQAAAAPRPSQEIPANMGRLEGDSAAQRPLAEALERLGGRPDTDGKTWLVPAGRLAEAQAMVYQKEVALGGDPKRQVPVLGEVRDVAAVADRLELMGGRVNPDTGRWTVRAEHALWAQKTVEAQTLHREQVGPSERVSMPMMLTRDDRQQLADLGYTKAEVSRMKPDEGKRTVEEGRMAASGPASSASPPQRAIDADRTATGTNPGPAAGQPGAPMSQALDARSVAKREMADSLRGLFRDPEAAVERMLVNPGGRRDTLQSLRSGEAGRWGEQVQPDPRLVDGHADDLMMFRTDHRYDMGRVAAAYDAYDRATEQVKVIQRRDGIEPSATVESRPTAATPIPADRVQEIIASASSVGRIREAEEKLTQLSGDRAQQRQGVNGHEPTPSNVEYATATWQGRLAKMPPLEDAQHRLDQAVRAAAPADITAAHAGLITPRERAALTESLHRTQQPDPSPATSPSSEKPTMPPQPSPALETHESASRLPDERAPRAPVPPTAGDRMPVASNDLGSVDRTAEGRVPASPETASLPRPDQEKVREAVHAATDHTRAEALHGRLEGTKLELEGAERRRDNREADVGNWHREAEKALDRATAPDPATTPDPAATPVAPPRVPDPVGQTALPDRIEAAQRNVDQKAQALAGVLEPQFEDPRAAARQAVIHGRALGPEEMQHLLQRSPETFGKLRTDSTASTVDPAEVGRAVAAFEDAVSERNTARRAVELPVTPAATAPSPTAPTVGPVATEPTQEAAIPAERFDDALTRLRQDYRTQMNALYQTPREAQAAISAALKTDGVETVAHTLRTSPATYGQVRDEVITMERRGGMFGRREAVLTPEGSTRSGRLADAIEGIAAVEQLKRMGPEVLRGHQEADAHVRTLRDQKASIEGALGGTDRSTAEQKVARTQQTLGPAERQAFDAQLGRIDDLPKELRPDLSAAFRDPDRAAQRINGATYLYGPEKVASTLRENPSAFGSMKTDQTGVVTPAAQAATTHAGHRIDQAYGVGTAGKQAGTLGSPEALGRFDSPRTLSPAQVDQSVPMAQTPTRSAGLPVGRTVQQLVNRVEQELQQGVSR